MELTSPAVRDAIAKAQAALAAHVANHDADTELSADAACIRVLAELSRPELGQEMDAPLPDSTAVQWLHLAIASARTALYDWSTETATTEETINLLLGILDDQTVIEAMTALGYPPKGVTT